jgi:hypothetical protein
MGANRVREGDTRTELVCWLGWQDVACQSEPGIRLDFRRAGPGIGSCHPDGLIEGRLWLSFATMSAIITSRFLCFGSDLHAFTVGLEALHGRRAERARFVNSEGTVEIIVVSGDRAGGPLAVGGELMFFSSLQCEERRTGSLSFSGCRLSFDGLFLNSFEVPHLVEEIRAFLRANEVSLDDPMLRVDRLTT